MYIYTCTYLCIYIYIYTYNSHRRSNAEAAMNRCKILNAGYLYARPGRDPMALVE